MPPTYGSTDGGPGRPVLDTTMATTFLGDTPVHTIGDLPAVGSAAPTYTLTGTNLRDDVTPPSGKRVVLNIFPSVDTDADGTVVHTELVPAIGQEPDYDAAIAALG